MISQHLNTLFVQTQGAYLRLDHDTVRVDLEGEKHLQVPLHHLNGIVVFGNVLVSPFLIYRLAADGRDLVWFERDGEFRARTSGPVSGNILLRKAQFDALNDAGTTLRLARSIVEGKLKNMKYVLQRAQRDRPTPSSLLSQGIREIDRALRSLDRAASLDDVRGVEGQAAAAYFDLFGDLLASGEFTFTERSRRPPRDPVNALLSFLYALVVRDCAAALEGVGLDPQAGYLHAVRPGRPALALDLMEEFRPWLADRLTLTLINRRQLSVRDFEERPGGAVYLSDTGRREVLASFQKRKQETVTHPLLKQEIPIGLLSHIQARLLARFLRGDLLRYVPFIAR